MIELLAYGFSVVFVALQVYFLCLACWALYITSMQFKYFRDQLHPIAYGNALVIVGVMLTLDFIINILASFFFLELPRYDRNEWLLSPRLKRWGKKKGRRAAVARWLCEHGLNQFDPFGDHC